MRYKLVISDFDGTLRRSDDTVSPRTVAAIKEFTAAGGIFGVSTGRAYGSIKQRLNELGVPSDCPVMCCQGALSADRKTGKPLHMIPADKAAAVEFLKQAEDLNLVCQFYTVDKIYATGINEINEYYFRMNRLVPQKVEKVSDFAAVTAEPILKTLCFIGSEMRGQMLESFGKINGIKVFASHPMLIEGVSVNAGKGKGLELLCENLHIGISESVAIGDELNDVEMISAAGLGIAMGNAVSEAKRAAGYVTDDCDCDGVAKALEKIICGVL